MSTENEEKPKKPWDDIVQYEYDSARAREEIFKTTLNYLNTDKKVQKYLKKFQPETLQQTLRSYAWQKARWIVDQDYARYWHDYELLKDKNKAEEHLGNIQQKKLFNKQCEFRAEQFTHPALETTYDFNYWERNILNCPFIDPVTDDDVELYIEFMNSYFGENLAFLGSWQDYNTYCTDRITVLGQMHKPDPDDVDEEDEGGDDDDFDGDDDDTQQNRLMPPWYVFWDERRGAGNYYLLKDTRQDKEFAYSRLAAAEERKMWEEKLKINPPDKRPSLDLFLDKVIPFIEKYERPEEREKIIKAYHTHKDVYDSKEEGEMEFVKNAWYSLSDCYEPFPITQGITDWKEALIATSKNWEHQKQIKLLHVVHDEYLFRLQTGIEQPYDKKNASYYREMADKLKAQILRGREIKGEPQDLNF